MEHLSSNNLSWAEIPRENNKDTQEKRVESYSNEQLKALAYQMQIQKELDKIGKTSLDWREEESFPLPDKDLVYVREYSVDNQTDRIVLRMKHRFFT